MLSGGILNVGGPHTFNGSSTVLYDAQSGQINFGPNVVQTIATSISVQNTVLAFSGGVVNIGQASTPPVFVKPSFVSGAKYQASGNGVIYASSLGVNFYPGTLPGFTNLGGQYVP